MVGAAGFLLALASTSQLQCKTQFVIWNDSKSGSHYLVQTLLGPLLQGSSMAFELPQSLQRLHVSSADRDALAVKCIHYGCPNNYGRDRDIHTYDVARRRPSTDQPPAFCGATGVHELSTMSRGTNWEHVFEAAGALVKHVVLIRTNTVKWHLADPAGTIYKAWAGKATTRNQAPGHSHATLDYTTLAHALHQREQHRDNLVLSACQAARRYGDQRIFVISYEDLQLKPFEVLSELVHFLDPVSRANLTQGIVATAIANAKMRKVHSEAIMGNVSRSEFIANLRQHQGQHSGMDDVQLDCVADQAYDATPRVRNPCFLPKTWAGLPVTGVHAEAGACARLMKDL